MVTNIDFNWPSYPELLKVSHVGQRRQTNGIVGVRVLMAV